MSSCLYDGDNPHVPFFGQARDQARLCSSLPALFRNP
jgi:hypothetical protein